MKIKTILHEIDFLNDPNKIKEWADHWIMICSR